MTQRQLGPWRIGEKLGEGRNGKVYRAENVQTGAGAALKAINARKVSKEPYQRFVVEIETLRRLGEYPGILPVIDDYIPDAPSESDQPWLVMPIARPSRQAAHVTARAAPSHQARVPVGNAEPHTTHTPGQRSFSIAISPTSSSDRLVLNRAGNLVGRSGKRPHGQTQTRTGDTTIFRSAREPVCGGRFAGLLLVAGSIGMRSICRGFWWEVVLDRGSRTNCECPPSESC